MHSQKDLPWAEELFKHFEMLQKQDLIEFWSDRDISVGHGWSAQLRRSIEESAVAVLLVSADFLRSDFVMSEELPRILDGEKRSGLRIVPLIVERCRWQSTFLASFQVLPNNGEPLADLNLNSTQLDSALSSVAAEIEDLLLTTAVSMSDANLTGTASKSSPSNFDVFLSYSSLDGPSVQRLANELKERGLKVWFDKWELRPGDNWGEALERAASKSASAAVFVGRDGIGPEQDTKIKSILSQCIKRNAPFIPVLLPDAPMQPALPLYLRQFSSVDLREGFTGDNLDRLVWGITGNKPSFAEIP